MNAVSKVIEQGGTLPSTFTLGNIFPIDTYGFPRFIEFIVPTGHSFTFQTKSISGWKFDGHIITIENDMSNGNLIWRFEIYTADDNQSKRTWMNHEIIPRLNQNIYLIAYY